MSDSLLASLNDETIPEPLISVFFSFYTIMIVLSAMEAILVFFNHTGDIIHCKYFYSRMPGLNLQWCGDGA